MNPALSVIFFTTLSGAGYGLWLWLGLRIAFGPHAYDFEAIGWFFALLLGAGFPAWRGGLMRYAKSIGRF